MAKNMELAFQIKSNMDSSVISSFKSVESTLKNMGNQIKTLRDQEKFMFITPVLLHGSINLKWLIQLLTRLRLTYFL